MIEVTTEPAGVFPKAILNVTTRLELIMENGQPTCHECDLRASPALTLPWINSRNPVGETEVLPPFIDVQLGHREVYNSLKGHTASETGQEDLHSTKLPAGANALNLCSHVCSGIV